jgi:tetratricopeptide (TPR) repeat protein
VQRQIDALVASLRDFVAQPNYPTLVIDSTDAAVVFPSRILAAFDRQDDEAYYLLFPQPCADAGAYFDELLRTLKLQLDVFNQELAARALPPLAALPLEVEDGRQPGPRRLEALVRQLGRQLPGSSPIVWALLPGELGDWAGYRQLIEPTLANDGVSPWMDRHRFLVRDRREAPQLGPELRARGNDRVLVLDLDLDAPRVTSGMVETATDGARPAEERMFAFFQLGGVDMAFQRYPEAVEKYGVAHNYYASTGNRPMQALCLSSAGDCLRQAGDSKAALERYQQSLALSVEERSAPLIRPGVHGAGLCCIDLGRHAEAEGYLEHSNQLAGKLFDPFGKAEALEQLGVARYRQGQVSEAVDTWLDARRLALEFGDRHRVGCVLDRLIDACDEQGLSERAATFRSERAQLGGDDIGNGSGARGA